MGLDIKAKISEYNSEKQPKLTVGQIKNIIKEHGLKC